MLPSATVTRLLSVALNRQMLVFSRRLLFPSTLFDVFVSLLSACQSLTFVLVFEDAKTTRPNPHFYASNRLRGRIAQRQ